MTLLIGTITVVIALNVAVPLTIYVVSTIMKNKHAAMVRISNQPKTYYEQCCTFISMIQHETDYFKLLQTKEAIDAYWNESRKAKYNLMLKEYKSLKVQHAEFEMMVKVYKCYQAKRAMLAPTSVNRSVNAKYATA
jgi:chloramphenicol O-acetyltransferase